MTGDVNLKELEKKAFKSTFQDGLWDIQLGLNVFLVPSGIMVKTGAVLLIRFMREYSVEKVNQ